MKKKQYQAPEQFVIEMNVRCSICDVSSPTGTGLDPTQGGDD